MTGRDDSTPQTDKATDPTYLRQEAATAMGSTALRCKAKHSRYGLCELRQGHDCDHVTDRQADGPDDEGYSWGLSEFEISGLTQEQLHGPLVGSTPASSRISALESSLSVLEVENARLTAEVAAQAESQIRYAEATRAERDRLETVVSHVRDLADVAQRGGPALGAWVSVYSLRAVLDGSTSPQDGDAR